MDYIPDGITLLPNTSGARNAEEAVRIARLARELGCGNFVKIEIMRDSKYLLPDNQETIRATEILARSCHLRGDDLERGCRPERDEDQGLSFRAFRSLTVAIKLFQNCPKK